MRKLILGIVLLLIASFLPAQNVLDLSGKWDFEIDRNNLGEKENWIQKKLGDYISLPGSMPEKLKGDDVTAHTKWTGSLYDSTYYYSPYMEKYRKEGNIKLSFFLTPDKHYVGVAWYKKEIKIPSSWKGERIELFLERPHIETTVWINGKKVGTKNSLCVPHIYDLTDFVHPGNCQIAIRVDNRIKDINVGSDSHSITDQTQGNWNGVVGKICLRTTSKIYFDDIQVFPDIHKKCAKIKMKILSANKTHRKITVTLSAESFNSNIRQTIPTVKKTFTINSECTDQEMILPMGENVLLWDEFTPALYRLSAQLSFGKETETKKVEFGMREFNIKGKWFYINGRKTMLRGTVENCDFPLTGYAPMDIKSWERVFHICRNYGLNHMRFHSYCPPEAAFIAADRVGFYLQPEGPSWPNHGPKLGMGQPIDKYLMDETIAMSKIYGNYASFCMLASGNEPSGRWVEWVSHFVDYWKKTDSRRVYTGASVGNGWQWQPKNQYHVKAGARGLDWTKSTPESESNFHQRIDTVKQPYISHEMGQWCAFPNFNEIRKYTGVNKAKNFEIFQDLLNENQMSEQAQNFLMASGKLQALCYKNEIEKTLRTPDYTGFQMLALNDYSGQGTALVGVLDVFFEEKGYINASEWRRFCSETVPLARLPKFVYTNKETFSAQIEVAHFGPKPIIDAQTCYTIKDEYGKIYASGELKKQTIPIGNNCNLGEVIFPLKEITEPIKLNLEVYIKDTHAINDWEFWVYPAQVNITKGDIYETDSLDSKAIDILNKGGKVLITANDKISYGKDIVQYFTPVFWNTSWFKMRPPHTTGIYTNNYHPLYRNFPTEYYSNLQWWELLNKAQVMQFSDFPAKFQPLVQTIDTWFISRKAGLLFEANVGNGRLMMTSMDIKSDPEHRIVARQLYKAILDYMNSDYFRPSYTIELKQIQELFTKTTSKISSFTKQSPDELKPKIIR